MYDLELINVGKVYDNGTPAVIDFNLSIRNARFIAFLGPLLSGWIISQLGGYGIAATVVGCIYILGLVVAPFCPETRGRPLPE